MDFLYAKLNNSAQVVNYVEGSTDTASVHVGSDKTLTVDVKAVPNSLIFRYSDGTEIMYDGSYQLLIDLLSAADLALHTNNQLNPHNVKKEQIGLDKVDNTSDLEKPISTKTQLALDKKADISYVNQEIANLIDSAPEALETLGRLAKALNDHEDEYDNLLTAVGRKSDKGHNHSDLYYNMHTIDSFITSLENMIDDINYRVIALENNPPVTNPSTSIISANTDSLVMSSYGDGEDDEIKDLIEEYYGEGDV